MLSHIPAPRHLDCPVNAVDLADRIRRTGQVRALLAGLGGSAEAVALTLHDLGITGHPESVDSCPIAKYLTSHCRVLRVEVSEAEVIAGLPDGTAITVLTPIPVAVFVARFDTGHYPHLIAEPLTSHPANPGTNARSEDCA